MTFSKILFLSSLFLLVACNEVKPDRNHCSDLPVCDKYLCEDGYDYGLENGPCQRWKSYCEKTPDDKECKIPLKLKNTAGKSEIEK